MAETATATTRAHEEARTATRPATPEAATPEIGADAGARTIVRALHAAGGAAGPGGGAGGGPPRAPAWTGTPRLPARDLVALQRMAGNRAVASLVSRRPTVQRQPKAELVEPSLEDIRVNEPQEVEETFALQYQASSLDEAARNLLKDLTVQDDVIVVAIQQKFIVVYGKDGKRLTPQPLELKLPEGIRPAPGVYMSPSAKDAREQKGAFALRQLVVNAKTKDWQLGGYVAYLQDKRKPKGDAKGGDAGGGGDAAAAGAPGPGAATTAPGAAPAGNGKDASAKDPNAKPAGGDGATDAGAAAAAKPPPLINLRAFVQNGSQLDSIVAAHDAAVQFYLVPQPLPGSGGKPGGARTSGFAGELEGKGDPPNAPAWPVSMDGPRMQPVDSEGVFSARTNWAAHGDDAAGQVISAVGTYIHYRFEVFDITEAARKQQFTMAKQARQTQQLLITMDRKGIAPPIPAPGGTAKAPAGTNAAGPAAPATGASSTTPANAGKGPAPITVAGTAGGAVAAPPAPGEKSLNEIIDEKTHSVAGTGEDPGMGAANRKFRRAFGELADDSARAAKDLWSPSGSTMVERQSNAQANLIALELLPVSFLITTLGATLRWFGELFAGDSAEKEIHFDREGVFLVRVIATPSVETNTKGEKVIRPSSVASRVLEVTRMETMVREALDDPAAQLAKAEADLAMANQSGDADRIKEATRQRDLKALETEGDPREYLKKKIEIRKGDLEDARKRYGDVVVGPIYEIERDIETLKNRLEVFELQDARRKEAGGKAPAERINAQLVSEVTGQTYPLMLSVGAVGVDEDGRHVWKVLDGTSEDAEGFTGYGATPSAAIHDALRQFAGKAQYGRGTIGVRLGWNVQLEPGAQRDMRFTSAPIGWAIARARLDDLAMTLAALGLFVASAGTASIVLGAAIAAARLIERAYNGTLRLDAAAVSDVLAILGAVGAAAHAAAEVGVAAAGVKFQKVGKAYMMVEEGVTASAADVAKAAQALETAASFLKGVEAANDILNYAGIVWGNLTFFNEMLEVSALENAGQITHAEARRRRATAIGGAINNNGMAVAPGIIKGIKAKRAAGKTGAPSESTAPGGTREPSGEAAPTPTPDVTPAPADTGTAPSIGPAEGPTPRDEGAAAKPAADDGAGPRDDAAAAGKPAPGEGGPAAPHEAPESPAKPAPDKPAPTTAHPEQPTHPAAGVEHPAGSAAPAKEPPKPGSREERSAAHKALQEAARGNGDLKAAAEAAIGKGGSWKEGLREALSKLEGDQRLAAEKALVEARDNIVNDEWKKLEAKYPGLRLENTGTKSFTSDIDATVRPKAEAHATGPELSRQVEESTQAAKELAEALRKRAGGETDIVIDTNIYSFIGEGRVKATDPASKGAQMHVDVVVGLAEQMRGQSDAQFEKFARNLVEKAGDPRVAEEARQVLGQAKEFHDARQKEWSDALKAAGAKNEKSATPEQKRVARDSILEQKKGELSGLLGTEAPNFDAIARKQSEINWFAPDAYATPSAFKQAVAHGQRLKGSARTAREWKGTEVATKLREAAGKLKPDDPRAGRMQRDAALAESQQRTLDAIEGDIKRMQANPPVDVAQVKELESYAEGLRNSIATAAEPFVVSGILGETMPAGRPTAERLSEAAAASGANMGMLEDHVAHAKDVDGKVKAAAKYAGRIAMAEFLSGLKPGADPMAKFIAEFVKSRWGLFEDAAPQILRDMFIEYAKLKGREGDVVHNKQGEPVGVTDELKSAFVNDVTKWARGANAEIQQQAIASKAFDHPTTGPAEAGPSSPTPGPSGGGGPGSPSGPAPTTDSGGSAGGPPPAPPTAAAAPAGPRGEPERASQPGGDGPADHAEPSGEKPVEEHAPDSDAEPEPEWHHGGPVSASDQAAAAGSSQAESAAEIQRLRQRLYRWRETADAAGNLMIDAQLAELRELAAANRRGEPVEGALQGLRQAMPEARRILRPVTRERVDALRNKVHRKRERARDREAIRELNRLLDEIDGLAQRMRRRPRDDVRDAFEVLRRQAGRAGRQDYEVFVDLTDPVVKGEMFAWFSENLRPLAEGTVGQILEDMILKHIDSADALTLQQSPRGAGEKVAATSRMQSEVLAAVKAKRYPPEYIAAFEAAARGQADGWPRTEGVAWEVDHVGELWMGGADDVTNYLALPARLHEAKSDILTRFRKEYREGRLVHGAEVDTREGD